VNICRDELSIGRNVAHCSAHYNLCIDCIGASKLSSYNCFKICSRNDDLQVVARANILREVLLTGDGLLAFSRDPFDLTDNNEMIRAVATVFISVLTLLFCPPYCCSL
jgi:hypothetical protein